MVAVDLPELPGAMENLWLPPTPSPSTTGFPQLPWKTLRVYHSTLEIPATAHPSGIPTASTTTIHRAPIGCVDEAHRPRS